MKRKYVWLLLSCLMVSSMVLTSCAPAAPVAPAAPTTATPTTPTTTTAPVAPTTPVTPAVEKPKYGGTLTIAISPDQRGFSPTASGVITSGLYTLHCTNDGVWSGDWAKGPAGTNDTDFLNWTWGFDLGTMMLAESYELAADNTLIYHIKKGIRYSLDPKSEASRLANGRELTAADVAYSLNAMYFDPDSFGQWEFIPEEKPLSIEATDKYTVKIRYQPGMTSSTVYSTSTYSYIFPPEVYGKYNKMRDWKHAVGTGGFILVDYLPGSSITMMRSPNGWWKTDPVGPGKG
ncbi:MAG: hypothetical protein HYU83_04025, partial [Chloroflexi bacterium]|nr:hypothetical protein [Chloroflexota bacterium]